MTNRPTLKHRGLQVLAAAALTLGATLAASAVEVVVVERPAWRSEVVTIAPPHIRREVVGVAPHPGSVYRKGYWDWVDGKHVWVRGDWMDRRVGYRWQPHAWVRDGGGWRLREGYWRR